MRLPALLVSDLHFTAAPRDAYRFGIFPWLKQTCKAKGVKALAILGDLTDAKDNHPARLVNAIVSGLTDVARAVEDVYILCGNHDYLEAGHPFFAFLNHVPNIRFIAAPFEPPAEDCTSLFLPHTKSPARDWADINFELFQYVFMHQTVTGSVASNGMKMDGEPLPEVGAAWRVYSGDIHVPQVVGSVEYVGSPYHVHFGDRFTPRAVLLPRRGKAEDLYFPCLQRFVIDAVGLDGVRRALMKTQPGDQVKVRIHLDASEVHGWAKVRREVALMARNAEVEAHGIELVAPKARRRLVDSSAPRIKKRSEAEVVADYVAREELGAEALEAAYDLIEKGEPR